MVITTDDFVKILLALAVSFTLVGIAVQIMRMMNSLNQTILESNTIVKLAHDFLEKFSEDYDYLMDQVKNILDGVSNFSSAVIGPLTNIFGFLKKIEKMPFVKKYAGGKKADKKADEDVDYKDDEE